MVARLELHLGSGGERPHNWKSLARRRVCLASVAQVEAVKKLAKTTGSNPLPPPKIAMGYLRPGMLNKKSWRTAIDRALNREGSFLHEVIPLCVAVRDRSSSSRQVAVLIAQQLQPRLLRLIGPCPQHSPMKRPRPPGSIRYAGLSRYGERNYPQSGAAR